MKTIRFKNLFTFYSLLSLATLFIIPQISLASYEFTTKDGRKCKIELVKRIDEIDKATARKILINSFTHEYQKYLTPEEVDSKLKFWSNSQGEFSVENYYSDYFKSEFHEFQEGHLYWLQAKINDQIVGWSTFEKETLPKTLSGSLYMNLLVVDPRFQQIGVGTQLTLAKELLGMFPNLKKVHVLPRKKNQAAHAFYSAIGFKPDPNYRRANNFVDMSLLESWTLELPGVL